MMGMGRRRRRRAGHPGGPIPPAAATPEGTLRLCDLPPRTEAVVLSIEGGDAMHDRLVSMGLHVGAMVEVTRAGGAGGPTLVAIGETRLAVGRGMAERVFVAVPRRHPEHDVKPAGASPNHAVHP